MVAAPAPTGRAWTAAATGFIGLDWHQAARLDHVDPYLVWLDLRRWPGGPPQGRVLPVIEQRAGGAFGTRAHALADLADLVEPKRRAASGLQRFEIAAGMVSDEVLQAPPAPHAARRSGSRPVVGFVDFGCAFAHRQFRRAGSGFGTRVKALWDQDGTPQLAAGELQWVRPHGFGYGAETHRDVALAPLPGILTLDGHIQRHVRHGVLDEQACYRRSRYRAVIGKAYTHGTHTMDLATGWPDPLSRWRGTPGPQPEADIVFVQLPRLDEERPTSGLLRANLLDAVRYIIDCTPDGQPAVINLSYGANAGPHDGRSVLDQALDALVDGAWQQRGVAVQLVIAAGNAREGAMHACGDIEPGTSVEFEWHNRPDDPSDSHVEFWLPDEHAGVVCHVTAPDGTRTTVAPGQVRALRAAGGSGDVVAAMVFPRRCHQSDRGRMALLAVARTRPRPGEATAPYGAWRVEVANDSKSTLRVDAWAERDTPAFGSMAAPRQGRFVAARGTRIDTDGTLNSIAHGREALVVGGSVGAAGPAGYSGTGPGRALDAAARSARLRGPAGQATRRAPDVLARADQGPTEPGLWAAALLGTGRVRLGGTSAAAARATRAITESGFAPPPPPPPPPGSRRRPERHPDTDLPGI